MIVTFFASCQKFLFASTLSIKICISTHQYCMWCLIVYYYGMENTISTGKAAKLSGITVKLCNIENVQTDLIAAL